MNSRQTIWACLLAVLVPTAALGADYTIKAGSTDVSVYFLVNDAGAAPDSVTYTREGESAVPLTPSDELAAADSAHADNKWKVVQEDIEAMGVSVVRYDLPDAVCAAGASSVTLSLVTGAPTLSTLRIDLVGHDPTASALPANVIQLDGNAVQQSDGYVSLSADTHANLAAKALGTAGGYNNVLEVGSGQTYSTIGDAEAVAAAGDLIIVHPGTYSEASIGEGGVTYYLARGAILDGADADPDEPLFANVTPLRVIGHGTLKITGPEDNSLLEITTPGYDVSIECDKVDGQGNGLIGGTSVFSRVVLKADDIIATSLAAQVKGKVFIRADRINVSDTLASTGDSAGMVDIEAPIIEFTGINLTGATNPGTILIDGFVKATNSGTNGISAVSGSTIVARSGGVSVPAGRPTFSGSGTIFVSDAFAYNAAAATATNIVVTPTRAMYAKLPSKDYLTGTNISTGDIQLAEATGEAAANVTKWAGQATATGNVAIKNTLAKLTDITGFNDPTAAATASAVRTELTTELARIDDSITSRHPAGAAVASVLGNVEGSVVGSVGSISGVSFPSGFNTLNIADNAVAANVTRFGGTAGTFAGGRPEVNTTLISNDVPVDVVMAGSEAALDNYGALKPTVAGRTLNVSSDGSVTAEGVDDLPTEDYFDALFEGAPTFGEAMDAHGYTSALAQKLENLSSMLLLSTTIDGAPSSQASFVLADGPEDDDALNGALVIFTSIADSTKKAVGLVQNYDATTKAVTLFAEPGGFQFGNTDEVDFVATGGSLPLW